MKVKSKRMLAVETWVGERVEPSVEMVETSAEAAVEILAVELAEILVEVAVETLVEVVEAASKRSNHTFDHCYMC
jgi:hypothetical protein